MQWDEFKDWSEACLKSTFRPEGWVYSLAFSPDGATIASGYHCSEGRDETINLWCAETGACLKTLEGPGMASRPGVASVAFSPDGATIASGSEGGTINLWSAETGACLKTLEGHVGGVISLAFSPDGATIASAEDGDKAIKLWV